MHPIAWILLIAAFAAILYDEATRPYPTREDGGEDDGNEMERNGMEAE